MSKWARRTDKNHQPIRDRLRLIPGFKVADTSRVGDGFPDLVVGGYNRELERHEIVLVEIKTEDGELTEDQEKFHADWNGYSIIVCRSLGDLLAVGFGWTRQEADEAEEVYQCPTRSSTKA